MVGLQATKIDRTNIKATLLPTNNDAFLVTLDSPAPKEAGIQHLKHSGRPSGFFKIKLNIVCIDIRTYLEIERIDTPIYRVYRYK